jgi:hypothetical protein
MLGSSRLLLSHIALGACLMAAGCAQPLPQVSSRDLSMGFIKIEVEGPATSGKKDLRAMALERAAQRTIDRSAAYFIIADEVYGTRYKAARGGNDFGVAPSYGVLETSTQDRLDMGINPDTLKTVPHRFVDMTIETFRRKPDGETDSVFDAGLLLSLIKKPAE